MVAGFLPLYTGAAVTSGFCCDGYGLRMGARIADGMRAGSDFTSNGFGGFLTIFYPNATRGELIGKNERTEILRVTVGGAVRLPAGEITITGNANDLSGDNPLPGKVVFEISQISDGNRAAAFKSTLKFKQGDIRQGNSTFDGLSLAADDKVTFHARPKGNAITDRQVYGPSLRYSPDTSRVLELIGAIGAAGLGAMAGEHAELADAAGQGAIMLPIAYGRSVGTAKKTDVVLAKFGVPFDLPAVTVNVGGGFTPVTGRTESIPNSLKLFVVHKDADRNKKQSFNLILKVNGTNIPAVSKAVDAFSFEPGDTLDIDIKSTGGPVEPEDGLFLFLFIPLS